MEQSFEDLVKRIASSVVNLIVSRGNGRCDAGELECHAQLAILNGVVRLCHGDASDERLSRILLRRPGTAIIRARERWLRREAFVGVIQAIRESKNA